jgi:ankyrin repeat protein
MQGLQMKQDEDQFLKQCFADVLNFDADDITSPIDYMTYVSPEGDNCLHIAALRGNTRAVQILVSAGFDLNRPGDMGNTPLHYAVLSGSNEVIDYLKSAGASTDVANEFGNKPV